MTEHVTTPTPLRRSRDDRKLWGVCGGLGDYFDVNPTFFRVGFAVLTLLGGAGLLMYIAAGLVIPDDGSDSSLLEDALRDHRSHPWRLIALGALGVAVLAALSNAPLWPHGDITWVLLALAGIALIGAWRWDRQTDPAMPKRRGFPLTGLVLGLLIVGGGVLGALVHWGVDFSISIVFAAAAVTVGTILIVGAMLRLRIGGLAILGILLATTAIAASTIDVRLKDGIGDRSYSPVTAASIHPTYRLGIGNLNLDLRNAHLRSGITYLTARVGIGRLAVVVPTDANVRILSDVTWGDSQVLGTEQNGHDVKAVIDRKDHPGSPTLVIDASIGAGQISVERAPAR